MSFTTNPNSYLDTKIGYFQKDSSVTTIYVGNMSYEKTEIEIKALFETYGKVNYVKLIKDNKTHNSKGIAFVQMPAKKEAQMALTKLNGMQVDGRTLKVSIAQEKDNSRGVTVKKRRKPYKPYIAKADRVKE